MRVKRDPVRLCASHSLIFFVLLYLFSCTHKPVETITIIWENEKAVSLTIPLQILPDSNSSHIKVRLVQEGNHVPILGELKERDEQLIFSPLIPFTRGERYEVFVDEVKLSEVLIPKLNNTDATISLLEIYPTQDTVPENLLKLFLKFSKPMREGESVSHLTLIQGINDTLSGVFLDLQPELWNEDQTMLTVWLDPGRIKRDLIPNLNMGAPLRKSEKYKLIVSNDWKGLNGGKLGKKYTKDFIVTDRDSISPVPESWILRSPKMGSKKALHINFKESLDYSLLAEVFEVLTPKNEKISGLWKIGIEEKTIEFTPDLEWKKGRYKVKVSSRLEDLAGNNLNRLFETDLEIQIPDKKDSDFQNLEVEVKE